MPRVTTSISIEGDKAVVSAIRALAAMNGITIGRLVLNAINTVYGKDLERVYFFAPTDTQKNQTMLEEISHE